MPFKMHEIIFFQKKKKILKNIVPTTYTFRPEGTVNNYINKPSCWYIQHRNYLSVPIVKDHFLSYFHII